MTAQKPKSLKLEFSKAADYDRVNIFANQQLKNQIDPGNYVAARLEADFRGAINNGDAAFLSDENGNAMTLVVNYHVHMKEDPQPGEVHDYTELGTTISRLQGYHSGNLVACAIALKEWWATPPKQLLMTEIKHDNIAPQKIYKALGWEPVDDPFLVEDLIAASYKTCPQDAPVGEERKKIGFYYCGDPGIKTQASLLLKFMDAGGVSNRAGDFIPVDFNAMNSIGLNRPRLEAIAKGELNRATLAKITP